MSEREQARRDRWVRPLVFALVALGIVSLVYEGVLEARRAELVADGTPAPAFMLEQLGGGTVSLAQLKGKTVMLDFWATWCEPCRQELPSLFRLASEFEAQGVVFVAADRFEADNPDRVEGLLARLAPNRSANAHVAFAPESLAAAYKVSAIPTLYLINREGIVVDARAGWSSESTLRSEIQTALKK